MGITRNKMKKKGLIGLSMLGFILGGFLTQTHAEKTATIAAPKKIQFPTVESQVSFKSVTELSVKQPNHKINYGTDPLHHGLLWKPETSTNQPLVVLIHGGCWLNAFGVDHSYAMATALAQSGFPVWSLEYRRTGDSGGGWPGSFTDIKQALTHLENLNGYQVNNQEIVLMGHSAGGHLALLAASEMSAIKFKQVIGLAAITDISRYALGENSCQSATPQFMGGLPHEQSTAYQQANLIYRELPDSVILLQGDADRIVPMIQSQLYGVKTQTVPGAGHFDWIHPGSAAFQTLVNLLKQ